MEHEQIMMIYQKTSDKKYAKFLSDEGWKYDTEADAVIVGATQQLDPAGLKAPFGVEQQPRPILRDRLAAGVHRPAFRPSLISHDGLRASDAPPMPCVPIELVGGQCAVFHMLAQRPVELLGGGGIAFHPQLRPKFLPGKRFALLGFDHSGIPLEMIPDEKITPVMINFYL